MSHPFCTSIRGLYLKVHVDSIHAFHIIVYVVTYMYARNLWSLLVYVVMAHFYRNTSFRLYKCVYVGLVLIQNSMF